MACERKPSDRLCRPESSYRKEVPISAIYYIGLDIHKKVISYCIKRVDGELVRQGTVSADRKALGKWLTELPGLWCGAMEATIFTGWVYDFLKPQYLEDVLRRIMRHPAKQIHQLLPDNWLAAGKNVA